MTKINKPYVAGALPQQEKPDLKNAVERELLKISTAISQVQMNLDKGGLATAWVCFNGATGAVLSSYNVSGVTRTATGSYTITFATPMTDVNYAWSGALQQSTDLGDRNSNIMAVNGGKTLPSMRVQTRRSSNAGQLPAPYDFPTVSITIHGGR